MNRFASMLCLTDLNPLYQAECALYESDFCPEGFEWIDHSDAEVYGGSGQGNQGGLQAESCRSHNRPWSLNLTLAPLGALFFISRE